MSDTYLNGGLCLNCGGLIAEPGKRYGNAGKFCLCPIHPDRLYQRPASKEYQITDSSAGKNLISDKELETFAIGAVLQYAPKAEAAVINYLQKQLDQEKSKTTLLLDFLKDESLLLHEDPDPGMMEDKGREYVDLIHRIREVLKKVEEM